MTGRARERGGESRPLPPLREVFRGIAIGLVAGLVMWAVVLGAVGDAAHHFSFAP
jgi:hypothetical protein